jgi:phosphoribosylanthranilate isomerase
MDATETPRVKICCIASLEEAKRAIAHGASALGLVSQMPSGPGVIDEAQIAKIAAVVPPPVATFLLTCRPDAAGIIEQQRRTGVNTLQFCDRVGPEALAEIRSALAGFGLVKLVVL